MIERSSNPAIEVHDLTVSYHQRPVLWDVDIALPKNAISAILGPNGAGKTTLVKTMMGLKQADSGYVRFFNEPLNKMRKKIAYVPQRQSVDWDFPAVVEEVVMMGRYIHLGLLQRPGATDRKIVQEALEKVELSAFAQRQISELSGGQQQRVFIARALAQEADIYVMDEPFAGIDAPTEGLLLKIFQEYARQGKTIVMVHHSLEAVEKYCDYAVLINMYVRAAGAVERVLTPQLLQETYGGKSTLLHEVRVMLHKGYLPVREEQE